MRHQFLDQNLRRPEPVLFCNNLPFQVQVYVTIHLSNMSTWLYYSTSAITHFMVFLKIVFALLGSHRDRTLDLSIYILAANEQPICVQDFVIQCRRWLGPTGRALLNICSVQNRRMKYWRTAKLKFFGKKSRDEGKDLLLIRGISVPLMDCI